MSVFTAGILEVELSTGVWTDITSRLRLPLTIRQGRPTRFDEVGAAVLTVTLDNYDGIFISENSGSAYYPNFVEGVRVRWRVTKAAVTYTRFVGWVQAIVPDFPDSEIAHAIVKITASDALSVIAGRKLRSNITEIALWRARNDSISCDVYEASGVASGVKAMLTNYSEDTSPGTTLYVYDNTWPTLKFGTDADVAVGGVVTSSTGTQGTTCKTICGIQANPLQIIVHMKTPESLLATGTWFCTSYLGAAGSSAPVCHLAMAINGSSNGLFLMDGAGSTNLGIVLNLPFGQWVKMILVQNATTPTHLDVIVYRLDGTYAVLADKALDIRTVRMVDIPGDRGLMASASWGGVVALGTRTSINVEDSFTALSTSTVEGQRASLEDILSSLGVSSTAVGTSSTTVATGTWSGRSALDVIREIMRSEGGVVWARGRDSEVLWIARASTYPATAVATVDVGLDCDGPPKLVRAVDGRPTRIEVVTPVGSQLVIDAAAEAGTGTPQRSATLTTTNDALADAATRAGEILARSASTQIRSLRIDLVAGATDHTAVLFDESTPRGGLYPTQRITVSGLPAAFFGATSMDVYVQGWTETYADTGGQSVILELDTSPA